MKKSRNTQANIRMPWILSAKNLKEKISSGNPKIQTHLQDCCENFMFPNCFLNSWMLPSKENSYCTSSSSRPGNDHTSHVEKKNIIFKNTYGIRDMSIPRKWLQVVVSKDCFWFNLMLIPYPSGNDNFEKQICFKWLVSTTTYFLTWISNSIGLRVWDFSHIGETHSFESMNFYISRLVGCGSSFRTERNQFLLSHARVTSPKTPLINGCFNGMLPIFFQWEMVGNNHSNAF